MILDSDVSRRDTTWSKASHLDQPPLGAQPGSRGWVRRALRIHVAETRADRATVAEIVRARHYLRRWPCPPKTLMLSYLGALGGSGAASAVVVALLPTNCHVARALDVAQFERLTLVRMWRADDLGPAIAPDLTPATLRAVVFGDRRRSGLEPLWREWVWRKCRAGGLRAAPRILVTHADPALGHDGATYLGAGATFCGRAVCGKLVFAWALDPALDEQLRALGRAVAERAA